MQVDDETKGVNPIAEYLDEDALSRRRFRFKNQNMAFVNRVRHLELVLQKVASDKSGGDLNSEKLKFLIKYAARQYKSIILLL